MTTRYWTLQGIRPTPASYEQWQAFRKDAMNFMLAKTHIEPGFLIQTQFIGMQRERQAPMLFKTTVFSDLGQSIRLTRTHDDAVLMHQMECQRLQFIVDKNAWASIADAAEFD